MNYQLPNGKVIYISIEEYLSLTDADIQHLIALDYGDVVTNPFSGSAVDTKKKAIYSIFSNGNPIDSLTSNSINCIPPMRLTPL